ncbi:MAG: glycoside hydrolase family 2 TIM barrel-domain containing protein [Algoriphagus sp.]|nr:glycoside hydrolase family 2 TIM barrel-domain containing protein [Algoriphagus sp.]
MQIYFRQILAFGLFYFGISTILYSQNKSEYQRVYLSGKDAASPVNWGFKISEGRRKGESALIPVPSNWEMQGFGTFNYGHDHKNPDRILGKEIGTYTHKFNAPSDWRGKVIRLVFDGAMTDTDVWINGKPAGVTHQGGFYRFSYDITSLLKIGAENVLEVKVAKHSANESVNAAEREADFWIFGGIFRPVFLEILPQTHFTRIAVDAQGDGELRTLITLNEVPKGAQIKVELFELGSGKALGEFSRPVTSDSVWLIQKFPEVKSWNPETPNLYEARFSLIENTNVTYQKSERVGFRTVELKFNDGIYVNGVRVIFKGVNRHSFYPITGRALSDKNHKEDILLMKEMNMNAVRMSHYNPDERFLDLCDSLGLFVLDEVTGWQDAYDTIVGPKLVKETVLKDANHASVVIWDHGNEGGWNFANEKGFHQFDIQKRPILYPWLQRNGMDTFHYPRYDAGLNRLSKGQDIFMPTELLHGLYDGGLGAGLEDFWESYISSPIGAGGFLWVFSDEALVRKDQGGIHDSDGNHAPDGILGPYREKEGSFYTIKSIWSPVQIEPITVSSEFDGKILVTNKYLYTDLSSCKLVWTVEKFNGWEEVQNLFSETVSLPAGKPGETRDINLGLPKGWESGDALKLQAIGLHGEELYTWSYPIRKPKEGLKSYFGTAPVTKESIKVRESTIDLQVAVGDKIYIFSKAKGNLEKVKVGMRLISLAQNTKVEGLETEFLQVTWKQLKDGAIQIKSGYKPYPASVTWTVMTNGEVKMEVSPPNYGGKNLEILGIGFSYPEEKVESAQWIGNGPYRVWQNRLRGAEFGLWEKAYNNTITGYSFENLIYPEFKGFHSNFHALKLKTEEGIIEIRTETPGLYLGLFKPVLPEDSTPGVKPVLPESDLSFLFKISPIGTKFHLASEMGPQSQPGFGVGHTGDTGYPLVLWFNFH